MEPVEILNFLVLYPIESHVYGLFTDILIRQKERQKI